jgi:hypothetical protein
MTKFNLISIENIADNVVRINSSIITTSRFQVNIVQVPDESRERVDCIKLININVLQSNWLGKLSEVLIDGSLATDALDAIQKLKQLSLNQGSYNPSTPADEIFILEDDYNALTAEEQGLNNYVII